MKLSAIITTYNQPEWLAKVLCGYAAQISPADEIVIADDGSDDRTAAVIENARQQLGLPLRHVWHEDNGFQKCRILNRAIEAAEGNYLLFSDGDCIPRSDLIAHHRRLAEPGRFLSGGYLKLPMNLSHAIQPEHIRTGQAFELGWLRRNGLPFSARMLRLATRGFAATALDRITPTRSTWNGNNSSGWATDICNAGGFDERMQYGGLDRELGERLENAGIRGKQVRNRAVCLHLDHARGYATPESWERNHAIREETRSTGRTRTDHGLADAA